MSFDQTVAAGKLVIPDPAFLCDPGEFCEDSGIVLNMLEHLAGYDVIECSVRKRQAIGIRIDASDIFLVVQLLSQWVGRAIVLD